MMMGLHDEAINELNEYLESIKFTDRLLSTSYSKWTSRDDRHKFRDANRYVICEVLRQGHYYELTITLLGNEKAEYRLRLQSADQSLEVEVRLPVNWKRTMPLLLKSQILGARLRIVDAVRSEPNVA